MKDLFKPTTSLNQQLSHGHHVANDSPPQQKNLIRIKSQMINIYKGNGRINNFRDENSNNLYLHGRKTYLILNFLLFL